VLRRSGAGAWTYEQARDGVFKRALVEYFTARMSDSLFRGERQRIPGTALALPWSTSSEQRRETRSLPREREEKRTEPTLQSTLVSWRDRTIDERTNESRKENLTKQNKFQQCARLEARCLPFASSSFLYTPYWVVATDVQSDAAEFNEKGYSWAIVSGGPLDSVTANGLCVPSGGLWLFVRDPKDVQTDVVEEMKKAARALGIDADSLTPVVQEGCTYP